jgi:hypothetical protein
VAGARDAPDRHCSGFAITASSSSPRRSQYFEPASAFTRRQRSSATLFEPQQLQRQIENAIHAEVMRYLYDEDSGRDIDGLHGTLVSEITVQDLLARSA